MYTEEKKGRGQILKGSESESEIETNKNQRKNLSEKRSW